MKIITTAAAVCDDHQHTSEKNTVGKAPEETFLHFVHWKGKGMSTHVNSFYLICPLIIIVSRGTCGVNS